MKTFVELDDDLVMEWRENPVTRAFIRTLIADYDQLKRHVMNQLATGNYLPDAGYVGGEIYAWRTVLQLATGDIHE